MSSHFLKPLLFYLGYKLRAVSCIDRTSGKSVGDDMCNATYMPGSRQSCNIKPCGAADNWYR